MLPPGIGVVAACWAVQQLPELPGPAWAHTLIGAGAAAWALAIFWSARLRSRGAAAACGAMPCLAAAMLAFGWAVLCAQQRLDERIREPLEGRDLSLVGVVEDMPQAFDRGLRFRFRIEHCGNAPPSDCPGPVAVRLGWYRGLGSEEASAPAAVRAGERWRLSVRLKRPHSTLNPGLFDAELRALEDAIAATGTVRQGRRLPGANQRLDEFVPGARTIVERARQVGRDAMLSGLGEHSPAARGIMVALAVGDQGAIAGPWWELFNRTGVGHLMSISGLHITMLAALGGRLAGAVWSSKRLARRMRARPLPSLIPTPHARWYAGVATGFGYAALAGWGIPAQRTCWMLAAAGLAMLTGRGRSTVDVLSTAAAVVCMLDPWAPMASGFWLSFAAVGAIIWYGSGAVRLAQRGQPDGRRERAMTMLREATRSQVAATLALLPLGIIFFSSVSLVGPLANALAIPLVSAIITPLALAGAAVALVSPALAAPLLWTGAWLADLLLVFLQWLDFDGGSAMSVARPETAALLVAVAACAVLLAPVRLPRKWLAGFGLLPLLLAPQQRLSPDAIRLVALDVGQGSAVLVETAKGRLLYDTGPALGGDSDAGSRVIVPYLRARGITRLQAVVVSHQDTDHSGGALALARSVDTDWMASSLSPEHLVVQAFRRHHPCRRGERWQWGQVEFEWLHPGDERESPARSSTNARSCVLRVRSAAGSVLLAGDIEAAQEKRLLELYGAAQLQANVLLVPHHGSRTSSTPAFIDAVSPTHAVFQLGYRNRYRHPNPAVLERYLQRGIVALRSDHHAALTLHLERDRPVAVERMRVDQRRYWRLRVDPERDAEGG